MVSLVAAAVCIRMHYFRSIHVRIRRTAQFHGNIEIKYENRIFELKSNFRVFNSINTTQTKS